MPVHEAPLPSQVSDGIPSKYHVPCLYLAGMQGRQKYSDSRHKNFLLNGNHIEPSEQRLQEISIAKN